MTDEIGAATDGPDDRESPLRDADASVALGTLAGSQVEMAETALRRLGIAQARVQHFGELARVIVRAEDIPVVAVEPLRSEVVNLIRSAGFSLVTLDMTGMRPEGAALPARPFVGGGGPRLETTGGKT